VAKSSAASSKRARSEHEPLRELKGKSEASHVPDLDKVIHERMRLAIVSALAATDTLGFNELKDLIGATDGNLSVHARKLEEARYITCTKSFEGRLPRTEYRLSPAGRQASCHYDNPHSTG